MPEQRGGGERRVLQCRSGGVADERTPSVGCTQGSRVRNRIPICAGLPVSDPLRWKRPAEIRTPSFSWRGRHFLHAPLGSVSCRHRQTWKSVAKMGRPVWPRLAFGIEKSKLWSEWDQDGPT
jgi:hypothetical protein